MGHMEFFAAGFTRWKAAALEKMLCSDHHCRIPKHLRGLTITTSDLCLLRSC